MVLVHGSMDRSATFVRLGRELRDHHVVRYDRRGYGRSLRCGVTDVQGHADDLLAVIARSHDGRGAVVAGHSLGGDIVLAAAERRPDLVAAAVVWEAPMAWQPWWPSHTAGGAAMGGLSDDGAALAAERFLRRMLGDERWEAMPPAVRDQRRAEGAALVAELRSLRATAPYNPARITIPLIVGAGTRSRPHHRRAAHELAAAAVHAELVEIEGAGHAAHATHAPEFAELVRRAIVRSGVEG